MDTSRSYPFILICPANAQASEKPGPTRQLVVPGERPFLKVWSVVMSVNYISFDSTMEKENLKVL